MDLKKVLIGLAVLSVLLMAIAFTAIIWGTKSSKQSTSSSSNPDPRKVFRESVQEEREETPPPDSPDDPRAALHARQQ